MDEFDAGEDCACAGAVGGLLSDRADDAEGLFVSACGCDESLVPVVFGADWFVVVADLGVWEDVDWALWLDAELGEEVDEEFAGADEFEDELNWSDFAPQAARCFSAARLVIGRMRRYRALSRSPQ